VLRLVRPRSYAFALGLGLVACEVCIPLNPRCLRAPCLYSAGLVVLRDHTNYVCGVATTVYRREEGPQRFSRKLDIDYGGERSRRGLPKGTTRDTLAHGEGPGLSTKLPDQELGPCKRFLVRGSNKD
jgi:hypothetical protein